MDFLESAAVLLPASMGMAVTIYDGVQDTLAEFEHQYCFSSQLQSIYTAPGLRAFFESSSERTVYELVEPLGTYLIAAKVGHRWILLGPCVEDCWSENAARSLLVKLGASESAVQPFKSYHCKLPISKRNHALRMALLIVGEMDDSKGKRQVETIHLGNDRSGSSPLFVSAYEDAAITNKRYSLENDLIEAVSKGDIEKVYQVMTEMRNAVSNIRFISDDLNDQIAGAAGLRTLVRMGAKLAGLSPVLIDSISQEYAQKMRNTATKQEIDHLMAHYIERICAEVRQMYKTNYSLGIRKAMDYMNTNLSYPLDSAKVAEAAGMDRRLLVRTFSRETGMTVKQYLAKKRCEIAAGLLRTTQVSVQDIAAYVGYTDNNYFTKIFKANQGCVPQDYRKLHWPST